MRIGTYVRISSWRNSNIDVLKSDNDETEYFQTQHAYIADAVSQLLMVIEIQSCTKTSKLRNKTDILPTDAMFQPLKPVSIAQFYSSVPTLTVVLLRLHGPLSKTSILKIDGTASGSS